jgi:8-oxo-dGTP pyrophosphatase MutT (NUDIX family)
MKLLKTIKEEDLFPVSKFGIKIENYKQRFAARAIVFDQEKNVALLNVSKHNYYKLPGGGIEEGEEIEGALHRECLEEIGCDIVVKNEVGEILEYRDKYSLKQVSYCFIAEIEGAKNEPSFEQVEIDDGFKIVWVSLEKAIKLLKQSKPTVYNGNFIVARDLTFIEAVKSLI